VNSGTEINISGASAGNELREFLTDSYSNKYGGSNSFGSKSKNSSLLKRSNSSSGQIPQDKRIKTNNFIGCQGIAVSEASD
jgi:hypothetical protein